MEREPKNERWGGGRKGKKLFQTNPGFWKLPSPANGFLIGSASRTLLTCVDPSRFILRRRYTRINFLQLLSLPSDASKGNLGSVIVPQYGSSKITVFVWGKNTILKFVGNISFSEQIFWETVSIRVQTKGTQRLFSVKYLCGEGNIFLEFSITWGRLKISRRPFYSCTIF